MHSLNRNSVSASVVPQGSLIVGDATPWLSADYQENISRGLDFCTWQIRKIKYCWRPYFFSGWALCGKSLPGVRRWGQQQQIEGEIFKASEKCLDTVTRYHRNRHRAHRGKGVWGVFTQVGKNSQTAVIPTWQPVLRISTLPCLWRSCPGMPHKTQCLQATTGCAHVTQPRRNPEKRESDEKTRVRKWKWEISDREAERQRCVNVIRGLTKQFVSDSEVSVRFSLALMQCAVLNPHTLDWNLSLASVTASSL